jgi:AraC-like DNA-binding protein
LSHFDLGLSVLAIAQLAWLGLVFWRARSQRADQLGVTGLLLCGSLVSYVLTSMPGAETQLGLAYWPLTAWCLAKAALLNGVARAFFADRYYWSSRDGLGLAALVATGLWQEALPPSEAIGLAGVLHLGLSAAYLAAIPWYWWRDQRDDLDPQRRRVRRAVLPAAAAYLLIALLAQSARHVFGLATPQFVHGLNLSMLLLASIVVLLHLVRVQVADWIQRAAAAPPQLLNANERAVLQRLRALMAEPRWYADPALTLPALARRLATNVQSLRTVINGGLGHRHFNDFLHRYRLEEAARRLASRPEASTTILRIALDCGFRSIGPFNRAFRTRYLMSPRQYRAHAQSAAGSQPREGSAAAAASAE